MKSLKKKEANTLILRRMNPDSVAQETPLQQKSDDNNEEILISEKRENQKKFLIDEITERQKVLEIIPKGLSKSMDVDPTYKRQRYFMKMIHNDTHIKA